MSAGSLAEAQIDCDKRYLGYSKGLLSVITNKNYLLQNQSQVNSTSFFTSTKKL